MPIQNKRGTGTQAKSLRVRPSLTLPRHWHQRVVEAVPWSDTGFLLDEKSFDRFFGSLHFSRKPLGTATTARPDQALVFKRSIFRGDFLAGEASSFAGHATGLFTGRPTTASRSNAQAGELRFQLDTMAMQSIVHVSAEFEQFGNVQILDIQRELPFLEAPSYSLLETSSTYFQVIRCPPTAMLIDPLGLRNLPAQTASGRFDLTVFSGKNVLRLGAV